MSDTKSGIVPKYHVERLDGTPVGWCFVLQDTDPLAVPALLAYADAALESGYQALHEELVDKAMHVESMQLWFDGTSDIEEGISND
jgi:hypothetical protein